MWTCRVLSVGDRCVHVGYCLLRHVSICRLLFVGRMCGRLGY